MPLIKPTASTVNPAVETVAMLSSSERELFKLLLADYREEKEEKGKVIEAIDALQREIVRTVSSNNHVWIKDKTSVYDMLQALSAQMAPTDYARELEILERYNKLKGSTRRENVETWLNDWKITYADGMALSIPDMSGARPLLAFTDAVKSLDDGYAAAQRYHLKELMGDSLPLPTMNKILEKFRNHYRETEASHRAASHSGFPTLRGEPQNSNWESGRTPRGNGGSDRLSIHTPYPYGNFPYGYGIWNPYGHIWPYGNNFGLRPQYHVAI